MSATQRKAHDAVAAAGLTPQPCEKCRAARTVAHHDDYDKPLEVRWLCPSHHAYAEHKHHRGEGNIRIAITPDVESRLNRLADEWGLQSPNRAIRRLLAERNGA